MIQTSLAAALLAASSTSIQQENLLQLLPNDAVLVATIGDFAGAMEAENPSAWIGFFTDERLRDFFAEVAEEEGNSDALQVIDAALGVMRHVRGGGLAMTELEGGGGVGVLRVTDGFVPAMRAMAEAGGETLEEATVLGADGYRISTGGSDSVQMVEMSGVMVVGFGEAEVAGEGMRDVVAAMKTPSDQERWWSGTDFARPKGAMLEVFVSLEQAIAASPEFGGMFPNASAAYFGMGLGEGMASETILSLDFGENDVLGAFAGALGDANLDLLGLAPSDALAAHVLNVDVAALIDAGMSLAGDEAVRNDYEAAVSAGSGILGVDLEGEIIDNLTGDFLFVQWMASAEAIESEDPAAILDAFPAGMIGIEDSEPFYTVMETLEGMMGPEGLEAMDGDAGTLWVTEPVPGMRLGAGLSDTAVFVGAADRVEELMDRAAASAKTGMLDAAGMASARELMGGTYVGVGSIGEDAWDMFRAVYEADADLPPGMMTLIDVVEDYMTGLTFADMGLTPTGFSMRWFTR